jgi:formylglycine-generating enzyme
MKQSVNRHIAARLVLFGLCFTHQVARSNNAEMQDIGNFHIDRTEVSIEKFAEFVVATKTITNAEKAGGGSTFEAGWEQRKGWNWRTPFGTKASNKEPAVHVTYGEANAFCKWAGKRLPTDKEWGEAAYTERRSSPPNGFLQAKTYRYPTGDSPVGANCLNDCGPAKTVGNAITSRGHGHSEVGLTKQGVNGLFDMGANVWEWVDSGAGDDPEKRTRGGSWWYGANSMRDDHVQLKPINTAVIYIGFRCAKSK